MNHLTDCRKLSSQSWHKLVWRICALFIKKYSNFPNKSLDYGNSSIFVKLIINLWIFIYSHEFVFAFNVNFDKSSTSRLENRFENTADFYFKLKHSTVAHFAILFILIFRKNSTWESQTMILKKNEFHLKIHKICTLENWFSLELREKIQLDSLFLVNTSLVFWILIRKIVEHLTKNANQ